MKNTPIEVLFSQAAWQALDTKTEHDLYDRVANLAELAIQHVEELAELTGTTDPRSSIDWAIGASLFDKREMGYNSQYIEPDDADSMRRQAWARRSYDVIEVLDLFFKSRR
jgi:hypothetical protein